MNIDIKKVMKIGFFDTGLGGTTIFRNVYKEIFADYIYIADTKNAPYGLKSADEVKILTENCIKNLISKKCDIIVVACNTATSAAIEYLREKYPNTIFIGTEPAIKPALEKENSKKIILTATSLTLKGHRLKKLLQQLKAEDKVTLLPLDKLVEYSDFEDTIKYDLACEYLKDKFSKLKLEEYSGIVLGCTHFPIFKKEISKLLPKTIEIFDSTEGITNNLKRILNKSFPENDYSKKSVELILTNYTKQFEDKFFDLLNCIAKD